MPPGSSHNDDEEVYALHLGATGADVRDLTIYTAVRNEVMAGDLSGVRTVVETHLLRTPTGAQRAFQSLMFHLHGYDEDPRELYHIPECRAWFQRIDKAYPFLIYFVPCGQYTLYVGSQHNIDGARLSVEDLWSFFKERDGALHTLAQHVEEPYKVMKENLLRAFRAYAQMELKPW
jgi:hypothetical protein